MDILAIVIIIILFIMLVVSALRINYLERELRVSGYEMFRGGTVYRSGVLWYREVGSYVLHHLNIWQSGESTRFDMDKRHQMKNGETVWVYNGQYHLMTISGSIVLWLEKLEGLRLIKTFNDERDSIEYSVVDGVLLEVKQDG